MDYFHFFCGKTSYRENVIIVLAKPKTMSINWNSVHNIKTNENETQNVRYIGCDAEPEAGRTRNCGHFIGFCRLFQTEYPKQNMINFMDIVGIFSICCSLYSPLLFNYFYSPECDSCSILQAAV